MKLSNLEAIFLIFDLMQGYFYYFRFSKKRKFLFFLSKSLFGTKSS